eukprot:jgi/Ulvmu1/3942/UM018_0165.1
MGCLSSKHATGSDTAQARGSAPAVQQNTVNIIRSKSGRTLGSLDPEVRQKFNNGSCEDSYDLGAVIGKGGFATVRRGTCKRTGDAFAIKIMEVVAPGQDVGGNDNTWADVIAEVSILCRLDHPHIISLREFFIQSNKVYLVTTLVKGGELLASVLQRGSYSEETARECFRQLLEGVRYCHSLGVVHRDLKLENLLLEEEHDLSRIRIVDFGLAKGHFHKRAMAMDTVCGTPHYVAPEVIIGGRDVRYGPEVDLWSCGVILFILLSGEPPFYAENDQALYKLIRSGAYRFQDPVWDLVSDEAKDLVQKLLAPQSKLRLSAAEALKHTWLAEPAEGAAGRGADLTDTLANMRHFQQLLP